VEANSTAAFAKLPSPAVYEDEYNFWPWGKLLDDACEWVTDHAPIGARVVDYMCGTGYLMNRIRSRRPDLYLEGWDISIPFTDYGSARYPGVTIHAGDALLAQPRESPDIVLCTAGIHHLDSHKRERFVSKVASELLAGGRLLVGEEVISPFASERERRLNAIELNEALLRHAVERDAPPTVLEAGCDVLANDLMERGEYKMSLPMLRALLEVRFSVEDVRTTWPTSHESPFGDVLIICRLADH